MRKKALGSRCEGLVFEVFLEISLRSVIEVLQFLQISVFRERTSIFRRNCHEELMVFFLSMDKGKVVNQLFSIHRNHLPPTIYYFTTAVVGGQQKMTAEELAAICEALGVPYDFFYQKAAEQTSA